jgi:hypothetical protein
MIATPSSPLQLQCNCRRARRTRIRYACASRHTSAHGIDRALLTALSGAASYHGTMIIARRALSPSSPRAARTARPFGLRGLTARRGQARATHAMNGEVCAPGDASAHNVGVKIRATRT